MTNPKKRFKPEEITTKQILFGILLVVLLTSGYIIADLIRTTILNPSQNEIWLEGYDRGYIEGEDMGITKGFLDCEMIYKK